MNEITFKFSYGSPCGEIAVEETKNE